MHKRIGVGQQAQPLCGEGLSKKDASRVDIPVRAALNEFSAACARRPVGQHLAREVAVFAQRATLGARWLSCNGHSVLEAVARIR
jgi:hypothetical protein